ncbi:MAG TPA: LacI family DNA-binding transcriptional regulator [Actinomycetes bacterium]|jgi:LacI family transcriptional regulator|nr:LacI family DNA-binding transcriptional regulator [Actinomycetes bacterium]
MRDVAAVAGVSLSTVSRVVNEDPQVDQALAVRVREAVELLGYRRDLTASTLRRASRLSASIGLVFEDVANPFQSALHRSIEEVAWERGVLTFTGSSAEDAERERELALAFCARRVDGLVVVPAGPDHSYLLRERSTGVALLFVDRPPGFIDADVVLSDNLGGARAAVTHLLTAGHRRIGFLGDHLRIFTVAERLRGYREALVEHGLPYDSALVRTELHDSAASRRAATQLLAGADRPTALFASQNLIAIGAIEALHSLGLQHQVALVGFDDVALAAALDPAVTVVAQDPATLGRVAAELLFARLDGDAGPSRRVVLPTSLIQRGSGELPPSHS